MLTINEDQMQRLTASSNLKTEQDIVDSLRHQFVNLDNGYIPVAIKDLSETQLVLFVRQVCEIGFKHKFVLRGDLYALVEACVRIGPKNLISLPILEHPRLSAHEKVQVMLDLHKEGMSPQQQVLNPP